MFETKKIPISMLNTQGYCEYQIYLNYVKHIKVITEELIEGRQIHEQLYIQHEEESVGEITIPQALKKSKKENLIIVMREVPVENDYLIGIIDEIQVMPNQILIIDDKPNSHAYFSNIKQILGYCVAFKDCFKPKNPLIAALRHRDTGKIFWKKPFDKNHEEIVKEAVNRIKGILNNTRKPEPTKIIKKCLSCGYKDYCEAFTEKLNLEK